MCTTNKYTIQFPHKLYIVQELNIIILMIINQAQLIIHKIVEIYIF